MAGPYMATFGHYDELLIVAEAIISIEGVVETRGGHTVVGADGLPKFVASMVALENGHTLKVPHPPSEVEKRRRDAIVNKTMGPPNS